VPRGGGHDGRGRGGASGETLADRRDAEQDLPDISTGSRLVQQTFVITIPALTPELPDTRPGGLPGSPSRRPARQPVPAACPTARPGGLPGGPCHRPPLIVIP